MPEPQTVYQQLLRIRESTTVKLKPCPYLRTEETKPDGSVVPIQLRYYQVIGVVHLMMMKRMILGDGTGLGKCVVGDTLLTTDRGLIPIRSLAPQSVELVPDTFYELEHPVQVRCGEDWVPVRRFFWNGVKPTYTLTTRDGYTITGTANHPVLVRSDSGEKFIRLQDLQPGDFVCIDRQGRFPEEVVVLPHPTVVARNTKVYPLPPTLTEGLARLLGYIIAEGTTTGRQNLQITQHRKINPEPHDDIRRLLKDVFQFHDTSLAKDRETEIHVPSTMIREFLAGIGITYTTARYKSVPPCILISTRACVREFLRGLFEGEAAVITGGLEFTTASEQLGREVQLLLLQFGILSCRRPKKVKGYNHTYWRLTVFSESAKIFADEIGFVSSRKQTALFATLQTIRNPNKDVVPYSSILMSSVLDALLDSTTVRGENTIKTGTGLKSLRILSSRCHYRRKNPGYVTLSKVYRACLSRGIQNKTSARDLGFLVDRHYYYDPVASVTEGEPKAVMDIEVDDPRHSFVANGFVNHNTAQVLGALATLWGPEPTNRVMVVTPKSARGQWKSEIQRFAKDVKVFEVNGTPKDREEVYRAWLKHPVDQTEKAVLLVTYPSLLRDWKAGAKAVMVPKGKPVITPGLLDGLTRNLSDLVVVLDEATAFKSDASQTWDVVADLSQRSHRCYGLTATLLRNNLMEGFAIYKAVVPGVFSTKTAFMAAYCHVRKERFGSRLIPRIVGYKNLDGFRKAIDPYFLGRPKSVVSDQLPALVTRAVTCTLNHEEHSAYADALEGLLELGDGTTKDFSETKALTALIYCQQVVDSLLVLRHPDRWEQEMIQGAALGSKEQLLVDLIQGELDQQKVIVYTRFASLVPRLQYLLEKIGVESVRITGEESSEQRRENQQAFQDEDSTVQAIFITDAGSEALNLQTASALVFFDAPWSHGTYMQTLGRPQRLGSRHETVVVFHLVAELEGSTHADRRTIDGHVLETLESKHRIITTTMGTAVEGVLSLNGQSLTRHLITKLRGSKP